MNAKIKELLKAYWLRPETALLRALNIKAMKNFGFQEPSLDLGCGDGTFSFIRGGGEFVDEFDVFEVSRVDQFFENTDIYDYFAENDKNIVKRAAEYKITVGLDHKENLLKKAAQKNIYRELLVADANKRLPFENETFQSVFSNIIYWLDDTEAAFGEINRVLKKGGECCVMLASSYLYEEQLYISKYINNGKPEELQFLEMIDRGRAAEYKTVHTEEEWRRIIENAGFEIVECIPHWTKTTIRIWDIGLRPIFPLLKKTMEVLSEKKLLEIKKEWIELFEKLEAPLMQNEELFSPDGKYGYFCFILKKK